MKLKKKRKKKYALSKIGLLSLFSALSLNLSAQAVDEPDLIAQCWDTFCPTTCPPSRSDNIPEVHVAYGDDEYLTGYIQALIDMHYYEFEVKILVHNHIAYVFNLPCNELLAQSILCFVRDVPCICGVERIDCCFNDCFLQQPYCNNICETSVYQTVCEAPMTYSCIRGIWFPQTTVLFAPLIADPRQVTNSAALRFNDDVIGKYVGAVSFGDDFSFYRWLDVFPWHGDLEFLIEAGIFAVFDLHHPEACHVNTDFFVASVLSYAVNRWSFRFRLWHLSSHLGDEFLICNPGFDRRNLSDEGVDFFASFQLSPAIRLYAGIGDIFARDHSFPEHPLYFEWGTEIRVFGMRNKCDRLYVQPFFAMHFRAWEEHDFDIDQTYTLGVEWSKIQNVGRKFRAFLEYHEGYCKEGQFVRERSSYVAARITYGF